MPRVFRRLTLYWAGHEVQVAAKPCPLPEMWRALVPIHHHMLASLM